MSKADIPDAEASTDLPDRQVPWGDAQELAGMTVHPNTERFYSENSRGSLYEHTIAYVANGVDSFKVDAREVVVPIYYSRFDDFGTEVLLPTLASTASGYGITPRRLEAAVRVATGGGSYHSNDLAVYVRDGEPRFLVEYQGDAFLCNGEPIDRLGEDPETWPVQGMQVPEGDATYRDALDRLLAALVHFNEYDVAGYRETRDGKHVFETTTGDPLYVTSSDLRSVAGTAESRGELPTDVEVETEYGEQFAVSWTDIDYDVGDQYGEWYHDDAGVVVGLQVTYEDPRTSGRVNMNGDITVDGVYVAVKPRRQTGDRAYHELTVERVTERLDEFEPTKKDWDPINNHL